MANEQNTRGVARDRSMPAPGNQGEYMPTRADRYGSPLVGTVGGPKQSLAAEGAYFFAQNATIDAATTLAGHAAPVLADLYTKPFLYIRNGEAASAGSKWVYLDYIYIQVITAGGSGTSDNWAAECDTGAARGSGGTALTTVNPNMQSTNTSVCTVLGGAVTGAAATASQRKMGHGVFRPAIAITGDKYLFTFGAASFTENNVVATATTHHIVPMPPVVLGPLDQFLLHLYAPSQAAAGVYKVSMGWWEK